MEIIEIDNNYFVTDPFDNPDTEKEDFEKITQSALTGYNVYIVTANKKIANNQNMIELMSRHDLFNIHYPEQILSSVLSDNLRKIRHTLLRTSFEDFMGNNLSDNMRAVDIINVIIDELGVKDVSLGNDGAINIDVNGSYSKPYKLVFARDANQDGDIKVNANVVLRLVSDKPDNIPYSLRILGRSYRLIKDLSDNRRVFYYPAYTDIDELINMHDSDSIGLFSVKSVPGVREVNEYVNGLSSDGIDIYCGFPTRNMIEIISMNDVEVVNNLVDNGNNELVVFNKDNSRVYDAYARQYLSIAVEGSLNRLIANIIGEQ